MSNLNIPAWLFLAFLLALLLLIGAAEYMHLAPSGAFYNVFLLAIGILVPSPISQSTRVQTPQASIATPNVEVIAPQTDVKG